MSLKTDKIIEQFGIGTGKSASCLSPLLYKAAFENSDSSLNRSLGSLKHLGRGKRKTPERIKHSYFAKMQHYNEFKSLVNGMVQNQNVQPTRKMENAILNNEVMMSKESHTR